MKRKLCIVSLLCFVSLIWSANESLGHDEGWDVESLIEQLGDADGSAREAASIKLEQAGPRAKAAVPALIRALSDENEQVRFHAANALGWIGDSESLCALTEALSDENRTVRVWANYAVYRLDNSKRGVVFPALIEALSDENEIVRRNTAKALKKIGTPEATKAVEEYEKNGGQAKTPYPQKMPANLSPSEVVEQLKPGLEEGTDYIWIDLGKENNGFLLAQEERGDGVTFADVKAGVDCRKLPFPYAGPGDNHMYFGIADSFRHGGESEVWIIMEYFDVGTQIDCHYDSNGTGPGGGAFRGSSNGAFPRLKPHNTGTWRSHVWHITDGRFENRTHNSDFRFTTNGVGDMWVNRVWVLLFEPRRDGAKQIVVDD